jgi:hypothetical protein
LETQAATGEKWAENLVPFKKRSAQFLHRQKIAKIDL